MIDALVSAASLVHVVLWATLAANLLYFRRRRPGSGTPPGGRLSVLVPARDEEDNLARLLPTLLAQDHENFEVVVVNDGSTDGTASVLAAFHDPRLRVRTLDGPPAGWVGKVHALFQATRIANGAHYLFLDADVELLRLDALRRLDALFAGLPEGSVMTGMPIVRGGGQLIVSLVSATILTGLPWPLVRPFRSRHLAALNGQAWMIDATEYHRLEPHEHHPAEVLEDVVIGRYLKAAGLTPELCDLRLDLAVHMYGGFWEAWQGFRKNAYLIMSGTPVGFALIWLVFILATIVGPALTPALLLSLYGLKTVTDRIMRLPVWISLLTPLSYAVGIVLQADSALGHWRGDVSWKGRRVAGPSDQP